jgi:antitoxin (DNA-binding transcriptional repressor) of toxin-antitoxin stability system
MTKKVPAVEFERNCAALIDAVADNGDEVLVEKDGHVVAKLVSTRDQGPMYGTILYMGDVVSPVAEPEDYDAMK